MLIAQITDLHAGDVVTIDGETVDTFECVNRAVAHLNALEPQPDMVIVTGDLVGEERRSHYEALDVALGKLKTPTYVIPGNHDDRALIREVFGGADYLPISGEFLHYTVEGSDLRLVALDTHDPGKGGGLLCQARLDWLEQCLGEAPAKPTLIAMHHPPFETGMWDFDNIGLTGFEEFAQIIARNSQVQAIACGHVHRDIITSWNGTLVTVTPSTGYQYGLRLGHVRGFKKVAEPRMVRLFWWQQDTGLVSHISYVV